jgi:hypothetical protein
MKEFFKKNWQFIAFCVVAVGIRFINFDKAVYFIYDVGRDSIALRSILAGDLKLVGPTTGLPGFFLGPLWYYVGLPGYVLSNGNPYGIQLWYIVLSSFFIPLAWILSHKLFGNTLWAKISALFLVLSSGSISGTNFVWNPMLSLPLMAGAVLCFLNARKSIISVYIGFFLLALTLQSEFAYAIFFLVTLWPLIPWMRGTLEWKTMAVSALIIGITLIPQLGFELRHDFLMTKSLMQSMNDPTMKVSQSWLWENRPAQLLHATVQFFGREMSVRPILFLLLIGGIFWGVYEAVKTKKYDYQLLALLTLLPYGYYLFWRGNYGYFFDYYITSHFILVIPLVILGLKTFHGLSSTKLWKTVSSSLLTALLMVAAYASHAHLNAVILRPNNQAGLLIMEHAIETLYAWSREDMQQPGVFRIYTPNVYTDHYDFITTWLSKTKGYKHPTTVASETDQIIYLLYEPTEGDFRNNFFLPWYEETTKDMNQKRQEKIGVLTVETWAK